MSKVAGKKRALTADEKAAEAARRRIKGSDVSNSRSWLCFWPHGRRSFCMSHKGWPCRRCCCMLGSSAS